MATNSILAKMAVQITAQNADFARAMNKSQRDLSSFVGGVNKIAGALGVAFGVQQIASFTLEVSKLAGEAKAVRAAFERLPESTKLMMDLKDATGGTVSELDLMKRAVQASNFGISLQALPKLLEFATLRAQQTGQSVDYLVDSIVTGIGRKSKLILDNLGISAVQLNDALGDTAIGAASIGDVADAVGRIIDDNLSKMNAFSENSSTKLQRLSASWTNLKVAIGEAANETGLLGSTIDATAGALDVLASRDLSFLDKIQGLFGIGGLGLSNAAVKMYAEQLKRANEEQKKQEQIIKEVDRAFKEFNGDIDAYGAAISTHIYKTELLEEFKKRLIQAEDDRVTTLKELRAVEKELLATAEETNYLDTEKLKSLGLQIDAIRQKIKVSEDLLKVEKEIAAHSLSQTAQRAMAGGSVTGVTGLSGIGMIGVDTNAMFQGMETLRSKSAEVTGEVAQNFTDMSGIVGGAIASFAADLGRSAVGVGNFGDAMLQTLGGFMQAFGGSLIAMGIGKIALDKFSGPEMLAAGILLTAAGSALSASIKGPNMNSGGGGSSSSGMNRFVASTSVQNTANQQLVTVLKGEDLWIVLQNYQSNNRLTRG